MKHFTDCYSDTCPNYLYPFFSLDATSKEYFLEELDAVEKSGCRGVLLEPNNPKTFNEKSWWDDLKFYLDELKKRGMKAWLQDDIRFPSGFAADSLKKYPHLRRKCVFMEFLDLVGPRKDSAFLMDRYGTPPSTDSVMAVIAYKRSSDYLTEAYSDPVNLTDRITKDGILLWDVPEGMWRIYVIYLANRDIDFYDYYVDMLSPESCRLMIDELYTPNYENLKEYYGNTLEAFFTDEPGFVNVGSIAYDYTRKLGREDVNCPWREDMPALLAEKLGITEEEAWLKLPALWHDVSDDTPAVRWAYMDVLSECFRDNFSKMLGDWCREHGLQYHGHVLEDGESHMRFGVGTGHFFRAMEGQTAAGFDLVLQSIQLGNRNFSSNACSMDKVSDPRFYFYVIGRLASSCSHLAPHMDGTVMCECGGANGWAGGLPLMKYNFDAMLIGGGNTFVSAIYFPSYTEKYFPAQAYHHGLNPQFPYQKPTMSYLNRLCHLLSGGVHRANALIYYPAEGDWCGKIDDMAETATPLAEAHIDYDFVPFDFLRDGLHTLHDGKISIKNETFDALIIPSCTYLPRAILSFVDELGKEIPVLFSDRIPQIAETKEQFTPRYATCMAVTEIPNWFKKNGFYDYQIEGCESLMHLHISRPETETYFFFNNSILEGIDTTITFPYTGDYVLYDAWDNSGVYRNTSDGKVHFTLAPGSSLVVSFGAPAPHKECTLLQEFINEADWMNLSDDTALALSVKMFDSKEWKDHAPMTAATLSNLVSEDGQFAGTIRYKMTVTDPSIRYIDLGTVGETATVTVNGICCGDRVAAPYLYDVSKAWQTGENVVEVNVATNLCYAKHDNFSRRLPLPPAGLLGPIRLGR